MEEIWKDVKGFEGRYQVSNLGRVKMMALTYYRHYPNKDVLVHKHPEIIISPYIRKSCCVRLFTNKRGKDRSYNVNNLVASHFMPEYKKGMVVTNIDGDITNNAVQNLSLSWPLSIQGEEWKDIKGFEGRYQISNMGRVRSLDRYDRRNRLVKGCMLNPSINKGKGYLRVSLSDGYRNFTHYEVHRLVALHFVPGYKPDLVVNHINEVKTDNRADNLEWCTFQYNLNYSDVIAWKRKPVYQYDLDGNFIKKHKCCSEVEKEMGTYQGAMVHVMYESKTGMWKGYRWSYEHRTKEQWAEIIKSNKSSRKPIAQLDDDGFEIARFPTATAAAKFMGVTVKAISRCCLGKSQKAAGYKWKYIY